MAAGALVLLQLLFAFPRPARAQNDCPVTPPAGCPGILALILYGNRQLPCEQIGSDAYSQCLSEVGTHVVGGTVCCEEAYDAWLCACPYNVPETFPAPGPGSGSGNGCGDPVDPGTGIFTYEHTDLTLQDVIPIRLTRTYREFDSASRAFGIGMSHNYDLVVNVDTGGQFTYANLILPDGAQVYYPRTSSGTGYLDAVFQHTSSPTIYYGSTITWSDGGWLLALKDGTRMAFGPASLLSSVTDRNGNEVEIDRDSSNNATEILSPNGSWLDLTYDSSNRVNLAEDSAGRSVSYSYNSAGQLASVTDANRGVTYYAYDSSGRMLSFTTPNGNVHANNQYDSNSRVIQQTQPDGGIYTFAYELNSNGNVAATTMIDPRGSSCSMAFNSNGYITSDIWAMTRPEQQEDTYNRDLNTNLLNSVTDTLDRTTAYTYDSLGNTTNITSLAGTSSAATTSMTYDPTFSQLTGITDPLGHAWTRALDGNGNVIGSTDPLGHQTTATYNSAGQLATLADALGNTTSLAYTDGILTSTTDPLGNISTSFPDGAGRIVESIDPLGNSTAYGYDGLDDVTQIVNALGGVTAFAYDGDRNLTSVTDANANQTTYTYDSVDRRASRTDPLGAAETYTYDGNGNRTGWTDRRGKVTVDQYDALNRRTFAGFGQNESNYESTINYSWDSGNRLTETVDSISSTIMRTFDGLNSLTDEQTPQGEVTYAYDAARRRTSMTVVGQNAVNYTYDNANRLTQIAQGSSTVGFSYDNANRRTSLTLPDGIALAYTYDADSRVTAMTWTLGGNPVGDLEYSYDADGQVTGKSGSFAQTSLPSPVSGNAFNADNAMTAFGSQTLTYDANGNLTNDGINTYAWDARNHMNSITGGVAAGFQYDPIGRRTLRTINSATTQFLYDGPNPVQELDGSSPPNVTANLLTGRGIDQYFTRTDSTGARNFLSDMLDSTIALADSSGTFQTQYSYDPFGNATANGAFSSNSYQFTGRENDGTGLDYYRARFYSPGLQRFISQDPIGFAGGDINEYSYVFNSPLNFTDPSGKGILGCFELLWYARLFLANAEQCKQQEENECSKKDPLDEPTCDQEWCSKYGTGEESAALFICGCEKTGRSASVCEKLLNNALSCGLTF